MELKHLGDAALLARLQALVSQERGNSADIIEHLVEIDRREIVIDAGYSTLFDYCVKTLRYSEAAAFLRIRAARAAAAFPRILVDLRSGALHLDAIMRLYPHLREDNCDALLDEASGATKREVLALVATLEETGTTPERDVIRRLAPKSVPPAPIIKPVPDKPNDTQGDETSSRPPDGPQAASASSEIIPPASRIRLSFTADDDFLFKVERVRALRRHTYPSGRLEDLLGEAINALLEKIDPTRRRSRPKTSIQSIPKRRVPTSVKVEVSKRDQERCAYIANDGRRCEGRDFLEYDHIIPWSLGGRSDTSENIRLLCRPHNQRLAKRRFGVRGHHAPDQSMRPDAVDTEGDSQLFPETVV